MIMLQGINCRYQCILCSHDLKVLYLMSNKMGAEGVRELAKANWPNLQKLWLNSNNMGAEGARELAKANWPNLTELYLSNNQIPPNASSTIFMNFSNQHSIKVKVYL